MRLAVPTREQQHAEFFIVVGVATRTVYVELLDEGVDVWSAVEAVEDGEVFLLPPSAPETEHWRFAPGSRVRCELRELSGGSALVATELAD
jgi:hypothetical protein